MLLSCSCCTGGLRPATCSSSPPTKPSAVATRSSASTIGATAAACALPTPFTLEDAADDAAALVTALGLGPVVALGYSMGGPIAMLLAHRHPELVAGVVVQATAMSWRNTWKDRILWRVLPIVGSWLRSKGYRRYLNRAVPKVIGLRDGEEHPVRPYVPWLVSEMSRNDPFVMVEAGRALARYDARPWAASLRMPAASLVTAADHLVSPRRQWALAAALGAETRQLDADHLAALSHPSRYSELTIELIDDVRQRAMSASSSSSVAASVVA